MKTRKWKSKVMFAAIALATGIVIASGFTFAHKCSCSEILMKDSRTFWDAKNGYNWVFYSDSTFSDFVYVSKSEGKISKPDRDDVIMRGKDRWSCINDTLFIGRTKYPIVKISKKELVVKDLKKSWGWDTLYFTLATNQNMVLPE